MSEKRQLQPGEEYLSIQLDAKEMLWRAHQALQQGKEKIYTAAFRNTNKQKDKEPIFHSDHVAIWKAQKKGNTQNVQTEDVE